MVVSVISPSRSHSRTHRRLRSATARAAHAGSAAGMAAPAAMVDTRKPVLILTGFLGSGESLCAAVCAHLRAQAHPFPPPLLSPAGKTTLLNHILQGQHGRRIAVIENEYGQEDIDSELVAMKDTSAEEVMMLNNGCLCCTVRGDLVRMLGKLYDRRDKFDQVVIETTGLANPAPIIQTFFLEEEIRDKYRIDGVVTLVDAKHVERHLDDKSVK